MRRALVILAVFASLPALIAADPAVIDGLVSRYHEFGTFNGAVLVAAKGEVTFKKGYGLANREWGIPNQTDTRFRLGSITKQFTAALILQLVAEGKVRLDASLAEYVPEYPEDVAKRVTVHQLLTHTSGIKSYTGIPKFWSDHSRDPYTPTEFLPFFANEPLDLEPGENFRYSNSGYFLLGVIVEKVTDQAFADALGERILRPLDMNATGYDTHDALIAKRATGYEYGLEGYRNARYLDMSLPYAAGALYSTVEDLFIWDRALASGKVLPEELSAKMFAPQVRESSDSRGPRYGYGWSIEDVDHPGKEGEKLEMVGHNGGINGFNTLIQRFREDDYLIVILNNTPGADLGKMADGIRAVLYGKKPRSPLKPLSRELFNSFGEGGTEQVLARYKELKEGDGGEFDMSTRQLFFLADYFERSEQTEAEIAVLQIAARDHPERTGAHMRLGDALKRADRKDDAVKAFAKALESDPDLAPHVAERLKELSAPSK